MRTVLDKATREELIGRIKSLTEDSKAQWGKMNIYQMLKHCRLWEEMALGKKKYRQAFIGRLIGSMVLKRVTQDEKPLKRNTPTLRNLKIKENGDVADEREKWLSLMEEYAHFSNPGFVHPFFGKMTEEQIGYLAYKHTDHHLRQFNH